MKKIEKILAAIATIILGVLLIALRGRVIGIMMTIFGGGLIAFGVLDLWHSLVPPAVLKIVTGVVIILCGWLLVQAVLYIVAALLLAVGILLLYDKLKKKVCYKAWYLTLMEYATPSLMILIGVLFLFYQTGIVDFIFIVSGIFTLLEGGVLLANAFIEE